MKFYTNIEMKVTDLRIGSYICTGKLVNGLDEIGVVQRIESKNYNDWNGIDRSLVHCCVIGENSSYYECDKTRAIKLNYDWLKKFEFHYSCLNGDSGFWEKNKIVPFQILDSNNRYFYDNTEIIYVHELQDIWYFKTKTLLKIETK